MSFDNVNERFKPTTQTIYQARVIANVQIPTGCINPNLAGWHSVLEIRFKNINMILRIKNRDGIPNRRQCKCHIPVYDARYNDRFSRSWNAHRLKRKIANRLISSIRCGMR